MGDGRMGVCVRVCVGVCLPARPCMCDEGSALVFPAFTCPGLPDLCRVGVLREDTGMGFTWGTGS